MKRKISIKDKRLKGAITLPGSKSISNRVLIISTLCHEDFQIHNLSPSDDTIELLTCLNNMEGLNNVGKGGTTMRFLTALLATKRGEWTLTGPEEVKKRPVGILVKALRSLGADITYLEEENYLPLRIRGKVLSGNIVTVDTGESSQYISALLLIAPILPNGLKLFLAGNMVSVFYIRMTLIIMEHFGIKYSWENNVLIIPSQPYIAQDFFVEGDWSAASYFYEMASFSDESDIDLLGLQKDSSQGDSIIVDLMSQFGVKTVFSENQIKISKSQGYCQEFSYDFVNSPDLAQTMLVTCGGLGIPAKIKGIENLKIKETNRIIALQNELRKCGLLFNEQGDEYLLSGTLSIKNKAIETYHDHRMAMSFAPLALVQKKIVIKDSEVVSKSYPDYWKDLSSLGFNIEN